MNPREGLPTKEELDTWRFLAKGEEVREGDVLISGPAWAYGLIGSRSVDGTDWKRKFMNKPKIAVIVYDEKQWAATNRWLNEMGYAGTLGWPGRPGNIAGEPNGATSSGAPSREKLEGAGYTVVEAARPKERAVRINDEYTAVIGETTTKVGDEEIPNSAILEVASAIRKCRK